MEIGQRFNPHKLFNGIFIPESIVSIPVCGLSQGAKIAYGRLCRYAGENGEAYPGRETLASEVGCSMRQVDNYIKELVETDFIEVERIGCNKNNRYYFKWNPMLEDSLRKTRKTVEKYSHSEDAELFSSEKKDNATPYIKENHGKRIIKGDKPTNTAKTSLAVQIDDSKIKTHIDDIKRIHEYYKSQINRSAWLTQTAKGKIADRLVEFGVDRLMLAIDNFSECNWYMKRHRFRRLEWFFRDSEQIEKWLNEINDYREEEVDT